MQTQKIEDIQKIQLAAELSVAQNQEEQIVRLAEDVGHAKDIMTTLNGMVQVGFTNPAVIVKILRLHFHVDMYGASAALARVVDGASATVLCKLPQCHYTTLNFA